MHTSQSYGAKLCPKSLVPGPPPTLECKSKEKSWMIQTKRASWVENLFFVSANASMFEIVKAANLDMFSQNDPTLPRSAPGVVPLALNKDEPTRCGAPEFGTWPEAKPNLEVLVGGPFWSPKNRGNPGVFSWGDPKMIWKVGKKQSKEVVQLYQDHWDTGTCLFLVDIIIVQTINDITEARWWRIMKDFLVWIESLKTQLMSKLR